MKKIELDKTSMNNIVFISSLDHSGSTMLDQMLGSHSQIVGLGEIAWTIYHFNHHREILLSQMCSCRNIARECDFWGEVIAGWDSIQGDVSNENGYQIVQQVFKKNYGDQICLLDSSKYLPALTTVKSLPSTNIKVLYLLKDVRSFTISRVDRIREKHNKENYWLPFKQFLAWYRINSSLYNYLVANDLEFFKIGYEEVSINPLKIMQLISNFIGINFEEETLYPGNSSSHGLFGNPMRLQSEKDRIIYDSRWFTRSEWILPSLIFRKMMAYNIKNVYSNNISNFFDR